MNKDIKYCGSNLILQRAIKNPKYGHKVVLTDSKWEYISMQLKRQKDSGHNALFYWHQSEEFFKATLLLPVYSKPLTSYYCFLNATKALLVLKGVPENLLRSHGVSGYQNGNNIVLANEIVKFKGGGVLAELRKYLGEANAICEYTLKDIFYNLPYIHRAFCLTYQSSLNKELFIPISNPHFVKKYCSRETWLQFELENKCDNQHIFNKFPPKFCKDNGVHDKCIIRYKDRFKWGTHDTDSLNIQRLIKYHQKIRKHFSYIYSNNELWYLKRSSTEGFIDLSSMTLTFAAMHRLSEISRYQPKLLETHLNSQYSWLINEFIEKSLPQFIDEISSEISGEYFRMTGFRSQY
jgi:hypothetical protein